MCLHAHAPTRASFAWAHARTRSLIPTPIPLQERQARQAGGTGGAPPSLPPRALALADEWASLGSVLFITVDATVAAVLLMADSLKPEAVATIAALKALGVRPVLLTGDKPAAARQVARAGALGWGAWRRGGRGGGGGLPRALDCPA